MGPDEQKPPSLMSSVGRIAETLLRTLQNRVELLGVELEEERDRLLSTLLWAAGAIFAGLLAIGCLTATIALLSPENIRPYVLIGFTVLYLAGFVGGAVVLRRRLKHRPPPFSETVSELKKDISWIRAQE